ncbi:hypothetical protein DFH28DRAFT_968522 [Melampsora americana]|nr:hypothetical protein DFH28DRAFT_968522 [Melampsora americana]
MLQIGISHSSSATKIIQDAWNCVSPTTIGNAFQHTGLISLPSEDAHIPEPPHHTPSTINACDPSTEQSISNLTMCLTQLSLKIRVMDPSDDANQDHEPQSKDANGEPDLSHFTSLSTPPYTTDSTLCNDSQIINSLDFINIDTNLAIEATWDDEEIVDLISSEKRPAYLSPSECASQTDSATYQDSCENTRPHKRSRSLGTNEDQKTSDRSTRPSTSSLDHSSHQLPTPNHASSSHIAALESLIDFCSTIAEKLEGDVNDDGVSHRLIHRYIPVLGELEDELRALEAVELLSQNSGPM